MDLLLRLAWASLALLHLPPAAVALRPGLAERLYGVAPTGELAVLLAHRGALFAVVALLAGWAAVFPEDRRVASLGVGLSVLSFLALYARAGMPAGALRSVAVADAVAVVPLALVIWAAWRGRT